MLITATIIFSQLKAKNLPPNRRTWYRPVT